MKTRNLIFAFGAALMVSFGVFSTSKGFQVAKAENIGTVAISGVYRNSSNSRNIYLVPAEDISLPDDSSSVYTPVGDDSGVFINGVKNNGALKYFTKTDTKCFYFPVSPKAQVGDTAVFKGDWTLTKEGTTYNFTFKTYTIEWGGTDNGWQVVSELEPYNAISLYDTSFDDKDHESFNNTKYGPEARNTYVPIEGNTRNSFAISFLFESYGDMDTELTIQVGNSGPYDEGHYYRLAMNNTWGPNGVLFFSEMNGNQVVYRTKDYEYNLKPGARHTIEFGSIYLEDSDDTLNYLKYDGTNLYSEIKAPFSHERSTKVSYYYGGENIFLGSTTGPSENTQLLKFNSLSEDKKGIYLDGALNDIPSGANVKGVPASKYNALINGHPMYGYESDYVLSKIGEGETASYYLNLEPANLSLTEGDVITLSNDFHFYVNDQAYSMSVIPVSFLYSNNQMTEISNIYTHLNAKLAAHYNPDYYDEDKLLIIEGILEEAETELAKVISMKDLWDLYYDYIATIDEVPYKEEIAKKFLEEAKEKARTELNALLDEDKYYEDEYIEVLGIINNALLQIENEETDTVKKVEAIVEAAKEEIAGVKTKQQIIEESILDADDILFEYLAEHEIITTTDLCAVGDMVFCDVNKGSYHSGDYKDATTRIATSNTNTSGNMIFQFTYESDSPSSRSLIPSSGAEFGAQIFIRMRGVSDTDAYRFDIATITGDGEENAGVALCTLKNDRAVGRIEYNAKLKENTPYKIECGSIDLDGYNRTLLFMKINGEVVIKTIVDSLKDSKPTVRITDSYVASPHTATLSAIEGGTTSQNYDTLIGRLILDESSSKNSLIVSLRDNDIPVDTILYPVKQGVFTINNEEQPMKDSRPSTYIQKTGQNRYAISVGDYKYQDGDRIDIGGYFGAFISSTEVKSIYRLFDTTFIYHEETNSWEQVEPTDIDVIKYEAQETIKHYVNLDNYSEESAQEISDLIDLYVDKVDKATTAEEVASILKEALAKIDEVNTLLDDYKETAKEELNSYVSPDDYRQEERNELTRILRDAFSGIDNSSDNDSIDLIVLQTKSLIDELKTAEERDAEDLADAKKRAKNEIESYSALLEMNRYSDENAGLLTDMTYAAFDDVENAKTIDEVNRIVSTYKESVKNVQTADGSTFDGEKYNEPSSRKSCGGSIETVSMLSFVALFGAALLITIKKLKKEN